MRVYPSETDTLGDDEALALDDSLPVADWLGLGDCDAVWLRVCERLGVALWLYVKPRDTDCVCEDVREPVSDWLRVWDWLRVSEALTVGEGVPVGEAVGDGLEACDGVGVGVAAWDAVDVEVPDVV